MLNNYINWTKVYSLDHQNGLFKLYVSSHTNSYYFGAVLYYVRTGRWAEGEEVRLDMKLENFIGHSEDSVYQQCIDWVGENLPGNYNVNLVETKGA